MTGKKKSTEMQDDWLADVLSHVEAPRPADDALIDRLMAVPQTTSQKLPLLARLRQAVPDLAPFLSPQRLAAEGVALAAVLMLGMWMGAAPTSTGPVEVDLSDYVVGGGLAGGLL